MAIKHKFKKIIIPIFIFLLLFSYSFSFADDIDSSSNTNEMLDIEQELKENISIETASRDTSSLNLNSRSCVVIDRLTKTILYGKNEYNKVKMASTTKIMTGIVIIENCDLNTTVEVSKKAAGTAGSRLGLKTGDKITIRDLLYGLLLCSGNDAAVALAEATAGSIPGFSDLMNKKAKDLGLTNTHFESPHGLDSDGHYTTAYELALLSDYALKNNTFLNIVGTKNYTITINGYPKNLSNTNELLGSLNGVYGVKTGFTNGANRCLVTACKRGNMDIICVVLGADTKKFRTTDSIKLIEYTFKTYEYVDIAKQINKEFAKWKDENQNYFNIIKGYNSSLQIGYSSLASPLIPVKKDDIPSLKVSIQINQNLTAPIYENDIIGNIEVTSNSVFILHCNVLANNTIKKKGIFDYLIFFFKNYSNTLNSSNELLF